MYSDPLTLVLFRLLSHTYEMSIHTLLQRYGIPDDGVVIVWFDDAFARFTLLNQIFVTRLNRGPADEKIIQIVSSIIKDESIPWKVEGHMLSTSHADEENIKYVRNIVRSEEKNVVVDFCAKYLKKESNDNNIIVIMPSHLKAHLRCSGVTYFAYQHEMSHSSYLMAGVLRFLKTNPPAHLLNDTTVQLDMQVLTEKEQRAVLCIVKDFALTHRNIANIRAQLALLESKCLARKFADDAVENTMKMFEYFEDQYWNTIYSQVAREIIDGDATMRTLLFVKRVRRYVAVTQRYIDTWAVDPNKDHEDVAVEMAALPRPYSVPDYGVENTPLADGIPALDEFSRVIDHDGNIIRVGRRLYPAFNAVGERVPLFPPPYEPPSYEDEP